MLSSVVKNYMKVSKGKTFFYALGDKEYIATLKELKQNGFKVKMVSEFCTESDKYPSMDEIINYLITLDVNYDSDKCVLVGLGEYLALRGPDFVGKELRRLKDTNLGAASVILLLRAVTPQVSAMIDEDRRLIEQNRVMIGKNASSKLSVTCVKYSMGKSIVNGLKGLLQCFEGGNEIHCNVNTELEFSNQLIPINYINTAYDFIKNYQHAIIVREELGTEEEWNKLSQELENNKNSLTAVFKSYGFSDNFETSLSKNCGRTDFRNWLLFFYLSQNLKNIKNNYLRYVVSRTNNFKELKNNILKEIIQTPRTDPGFADFYNDRKKLIKNLMSEDRLSEAEVKSFIDENNIDLEESIYRLTDCTQVEREEIIKWLSGKEYIAGIDKIYPDLSYYLGDYVFSCGKSADKFTKYFKQYKMQKVTNQIYPEFLATVLSNAENALSIYAQVEETRDNIIKNIKNKDKACLYWVDALGVEYLAFITELAQQKGLSIHVDITYAEIPTITEINKKFYDDWGYQKKKDPRLDDIKHKDKGGFDFEKCDAPIHIVSELDVIRDIINRAATKLVKRECESFVIASDHGASRLAVIRRQEEKYETDTKGEHSGRCCKYFKNADLKYAISDSDNKYLVLADYGRFKKSRAANVEVHGGASLEELLVPIITLTLKEDQRVPLIRIPHPETIFADRHEGTTFELYVSYVGNKDNIWVVLDGNRYHAEPEDSSHFLVHLPDNKRAKKNVVATVYEGEDSLGHISFEIKGKMATITDDFEDLD